MLCKFPQTLAKLRRQRGISHKKAAEELGISPALLSHYENGIRECGLDFLSRAADYYGVSVDYILEREKSSSSSDELNEREKTMLQMFRSYSPELQERFLALFETALKDKGILQ
jgi:transcriptional regulator with XRE-family HTH domain